MENAIKNNLEYFTHASQRYEIRKITWFLVEDIRMINCSWLTSKFSDSDPVSEIGRMRFAKVLWGNSGLYFNQRDPLLTRKVLGIIWTTAKDNTHHIY